MKTPGGGFWPRNAITEFGEALMIDPKSERSDIGDPECGLLRDEILALVVLEESGIEPKYGDRELVGGSKGEPEWSTPNS